MPPRSTLAPARSSATGSSAGSLAAPPPRSTCSLTARRSRRSPAPPHRRPTPPPGRGRRGRPRPAGGTSSSLLPSLAPADVRRQVLDRQTARRREPLERLAELALDLRPVGLDHVPRHVVAAL